MVRDIAGPKQLVTEFRAIAEKLKPHQNLLPGKTAMPTRNLSISISISIIQKERHYQPGSERSYTPEYARKIVKSSSE